jgi:hypothetical protein
MIKLEEAIDEGLVMVILLCKKCAIKLDVYEEWYFEEITCISDLHCHECGSEASDANQMSDVSRDLIEERAILKRNW